MSSCRTTSHLGFGLLRIEDGQLARHEIIPVERTE
jgi:hypothetical protein